jgi:hypothetical protein
MSMSKEYQALFTRIQVLCLAISTLMCVNIATARPPERAIKGSVCKLTQPLFEARCQVRPQQPAVRRFHTHTAISWVVHEAYMGNFDPIVEGLLAEIKKKLRSELGLFSSRQGGSAVHNATESSDALIR